MNGRMKITSMFVYQHDTIHVRRHDAKGNSISRQYRLTRESWKRILYMDCKEFHGNSQNACIIY